MEKQNIERIDPPYKYLEENKKNILGYLLAKRTAMEIMNYSDIKKVFDIERMKPAFQWFDIESCLSIWGEIFSFYYGQTNNYEDSKLYTLTDFFVYYINFCPDTFISIISKHLKNNYLSSENIKKFNKILLRLGYQYEEGIFCSTSSIPEKRIEINSLIDFKLKIISIDLHNTWKSMSEDLVSNNKDKATTISAKSRKLINGLLRALTPGLNLEKEEEDKIKKRLQLILRDKKQQEIIDKLSELINKINKSQAKGDHEFVNESTAIFTFQITELIIFWILSFNK